MSEDAQAQGGNQEYRGGFDRVPPQDLNAEMATLGGMLLSKDAIADVIETLRGSDFYRSVHESIFEAIVDVYNRSEPADALIVADELAKRGELERIGGAAYLTSLMGSVPTAANASYYARIVKEKALMRGLVQAGTRITQLGYSTDAGILRTWSPWLKPRCTRWRTLRGKKKIMFLWGVSSMTQT